MKAISCTICKGFGLLEEPFHSDRVVNNKIMARLLYKDGYSQRQIMKFLGYKSVASVTHLLKNDRGL